MPCASRVSAVNSLFITSNGLGNFESGADTLAGPVVSVVAGG
jgi:hypothetical protein